MKLGINQLFKYVFSSIGVALLFPLQQFNYDCIPKNAPSSTGKKKASKQGLRKQTNKQVNAEFISNFSICLYSFSWR